MGIALHRHGEARVRRHHDGAPLILAGLLLAVLFAVFAWIVGLESGALSPIVIGVGFGLILAGFGIYYWARHT